MAIELNDPALHVGIVTARGELMLDFYTRVLGLEPVGQVNFAGLGVVNKLRCGGSILKLLVLEKPAAAGNPGGGFSAATGIRYLSLGIQNLAAVVADCRSAGAAVMVEPSEIRPGTWVAMLEDPDGNALELMQVDNP